MLASKAALATRVDALREDDGSVDLGATHRVKLESMLKILEEGSVCRLSKTGKAKTKLKKYQSHPH